MTKLDDVVARVRQLPQERQDAIAAEIDHLLGQSEAGSLFSDAEWALIAPTLDVDDAEIPHQQVVCN